MTRIRKGLRWLVPAALLCAQAAGAAEPPAEALVADLPFLAVPFSPRIHIDLARPGDPPIPVVLDTGISFSIGSPAAVLALAGRADPDSKDTVWRKTILEREIPFLAADHRDPLKTSKRWLRFGGPPLEDFVVEIDFERRRVRFFDADLYEIPKVSDQPGEAVLELVSLMSRPRLEIQVNERPVSVALETTLAAPLWIGTRDLKLAAVHPKSLPILRNKHGRGTSKGRLYETNSVRVGPFAFSHIPVIVGSSGASLGLDVLSQFRVRLDLRRSRMSLERRKDEAASYLGMPFSHTKASGAFLLPLGERWTVVGVLPDSPAAALGLAPGDAIDPRDVGTHEPAVLLGRLRAGKPVTVRRFDGLAEVAVELPLD